ncbi:hypothetical protein ACH4GP_17955 [Streptomyces celluloflavus]|uniref:Transposase n=1 Tax=Streptomyces celluloflavus TaxID=58344 RepID=A0ABW7RDX4_9ACTN
MSVARRTGAPLSRWSCPEPAREVAAQSIAGSISSSTVRRRLNQDALKPWQFQSCISLRAPVLRPKAARVLDLYARTFDDVPLGADEYAISTNGKTSIRLRAFKNRYNATAQPFRWRFTTSDPDDLPARIDRHTIDRQEDSSACVTA